jgi:hypothetical protein
MLHLHRDHHHIQSRHRIDQGCHLHLLHHCHLHYDRGESLRGGMDNSSDNVEVMVVYNFRNGSRGKRI